MSTTIINKDVIAIVATHRTNSPNPNVLTKCVRSARDSCKKELILITKNITD